LARLLILSASTASDIVAIDAKTSRRTHGRNKDRSPLKRVSDRVSSQCLVLGRQRCCSIASR
jgi:hypothetical protein